MSRSLVRDAIQDWDRSRAVDLDEVLGSSSAYPAKAPMWALP